MKPKILFFLLFGVFLVPFNIRAECDYQRKAELMKLASNVKISYNYELVDRDMIYHVELSNLTEDIYAIDNSNTVFNFMSFSKIYYGDSYETFGIYSNDPNCQGERLLNKNFKLPYFNSYSLLPECKSNSDHPLCQIWSDTKSYNLQQFLKALENVPESTDKENIEIEKIGNYYFLIFIVVFAFTVITTVVVVFIRLKNRR